MTIYNLSDPDKHYRQNNNEVKPLIRCKPTATVEVLDLMDYEPAKYITGKYKQPEDNLTAYIETRYGRDAPEDWTAIERAVNRIYGRKICGLFTGSLREALQTVACGSPLAVSTRLTNGGHVVSIVGFETSQPRGGLIKLEYVENVIIDDPYGNKTSGVYKTEESGFNNKYKTKIFEAIYKGYGLEVLRK